MSWFSPAPADPEVTRDARLLERAAAGDETAWQTLMDQELTRAYHLARTLLHHDAEAEEAALEAFARLWRQAPAWQPRARVSTWLHHVVRTICLDRLRRQRQTVALEDLEEEPALPETEESDLFRREVAQVVETALARLPERQRTALTLVYRLDLDTREAAATMAISVEALESLLARGRRTLKRILLPHKQALLDD